GGAQLPGRHRKLSASAGRRREEAVVVHFALNPMVDGMLGKVFGNDEQHGPPPPLLLMLTIVTGIVDAVSYLALNHVFVANMTGNVVFLGFAIAGSQEFSIAAALVAIGAFLA